MDYKDQVIKKLHDLPVGMEYPLTKEKNPEAFSKVVKSFIRLDFGQPFGWYIEFRDDYGSIKKKEYIRLPATRHSAQAASSSNLK